MIEFLSLLCLCAAIVVHSKAKEKMQKATSILNDHQRVQASDSYYLIRKRLKPFHFLLIIFLVIGISIFRDQYTIIVLGFTAFSLLLHTIHIHYTKKELNKIYLPETYAKRVLNANTMLYFFVIFLGCFIVLVFKWGVLKTLFNQ